jgi:GT2 family glycosyltransferase
MATDSRLPVSLIIATRGRAEFLPDALVSAAGALRAGDALIVVESGGSGAAAAIAGLAERRVRIEYMHVDRSGKSHQLNLGVRTATTDVLLFTDDDVRVDPGWADAMAASFEDPGVGAAFGRIRGLTMAPGFDGPPSVPLGEAPYETWDFAHGAAMALRRPAVTQVGGFDERLGPGAPAHGEEHDLVLRLRERSWRVVLTDAPPAQHLEWRKDQEQRRNALVYERGGGAVVGAALRRSRREGTRYLRHRLMYQRMLIRADRRFGLRGLLAFGGGLLYGLRLTERDWLN